VSKLIVPVAAVAETVIVSRIPVINGLIKVLYVVNVLAPNTPLLPSQYSVVWVPVKQLNADPLEVLIPTVCVVLFVTM